MKEFFEQIWNMPAQNIWDGLNWVGIVFLIGLIFTVGWIFYIIKK